MAYEGYQVVVVTPAGRRRYMEVLAHYVFASDIVDRWDLWINTRDEKDLDYLAALSQAESKPIHMVLVPYGDPDRFGHNIHHFYEHAQDEGTIYVRLDDDIVYLAPDFFESLIHCRLRNPKALLVSANVVNNAICGYLQQRKGVLGTRHGVIGYRCMDQVGWRCHQHAEYVHRQFLKAIHASIEDAWKVQDWLLLDAERFSVNAICWFGAAMQAIYKTTDGAGVGDDEEHWLTALHPSYTRIPNVICGSAICAHFAYGPQREYLDSTDLLAQYRRVAEEIHAKQQEERQEQDQEQEQEQEGATLEC